MTLILYNNSSEFNRVDKSSYLTNATPFMGTMRDEGSISELTIELHSQSMPNFNYAKIIDFDRCYFINDIRFIVNDLWELDLSIDVLMTYKWSLYELNAFVDRNETTYNNNIIDKDVVFEQGVDVEVIEIINGLEECGKYSPPLPNPDPNAPEGLQWNVSFVMTGYKIFLDDTSTDLALDNFEIILP